MLKDEIKKKKTWVNQVNLWNLWSETWNWDNLIKSKLKINIKSNH
jgi:hypothetical protein